jgi:hypothetical protein
LTLIRSFFFLYLIAFGLSSAAIAQEKPCVPCAIPCQITASDTLFDIETSKGNVLENYRSIQRTVTEDISGKHQALRLFTYRDGRCVDTTVAVATIRAVSMGGLGSKGSPLTIPVLPSRELWRTTSNKIPINFLEITALPGYAGADTSTRKVGFPSFYEGVEVLAAPFGDMLGEKTVLVVGAEALIESGRVRIPVMGQVRYTIWGSQHLADSAKYYPSNCAISCPGTTPLKNPYPSFTETSDGSAKDSASFFIHDPAVVRSSVQPFIFGEAAYILNTGFSGAGKDPSLNPEDYGQWFIGAGIGTPFLGSLTGSIGYRVMRLNLRTPCEACSNKFIVNTDLSNSVVAKLGLRF